MITVACTDAVPLSGGHRSDSFQVEGRLNPPGSTGSVDLYMATPGYFDTFGIPRIAGRDFAEEDPVSPRVAVVNAVFAQRFFPGRNPLGQRVRDGNRVYEIIGVVGNTKSRTLGEDLRPVLYRSLAQDLADDPSFTGYSVVARFANNSGLWKVPHAARSIRSIPRSLFSIYAASRNIFATLCFCRGWREHCSVFSVLSGWRWPQSDCTAS